MSAIAFLRRIYRDLGSKREARELERFSPTLRRQVNLNPAHLELVQRALRGVVGEVGGTAHGIEMSTLDIAGKTGTAQVSRLRRLVEGGGPVEISARDHAWFAAFAPAHAPEVSIVVFVEHGGSGGSEAAPVARDILVDYFTRIRPGSPPPGMVNAQRRNAAAPGRR